MTNAPATPPKPNSAASETRKEAGNAASDAPESDSPAATHPSPQTPLLARISAPFKRLIGLKSDSTIRTELEDALDQAEHSDSSFSPEEKAMLRNILRLREVRVDDIMVPRADIVAVDTNLTLGELTLTFREAGHSRLPVYRDNLDDPIGMVHIKDLMRKVTASVDVEPDKTNPDLAHFRLDLEGVNLEAMIDTSGLLRHVLFVPPSMPTTDLLAKMQATRAHMALVIDEYGGTDGLVTIEDLIETVVGDIEDEHDEEEGALIEQVGDHAFLADARASLDDVRALLGEAFDTSEHDEDVDTLGGLVFTLVNRVPIRGELITAMPGYEFEVLDADPRRIKRMRILRKNAQAKAPQRTSPEPKAQQA